MLQLLTPRRYVASAFLLSPAELATHGIRGLIVDLDNTLIPWHGGQPRDARLQKLVRSYREAGIRLCIVSNNRQRRVAAFGQALDVPFIADAVKPRRAPFRRAMAMLKTSSEETAVMGDQIFTDILGGNRLGLYTILVKPMSSREFIGTRLVRKLERRVLGTLQRRGLLDLSVDDD